MSDKVAPLEVRACDCAGCGKWLLALDWASSLAWYRSLPAAEQQQVSLLAGRIDGRPYCDDCLAPSPRTPRGVPPPTPDPSPSLESAVRALEDAPAALDG